VVWYTGQFYALAYMQTVLKIPYVTVYTVMMVALIFGAPFFVFWGWLSDRYGRRWIMTAGFALAVASYWPAFTWLGTFKDNPVILTALVWYMVILVTMVYGPIAAFLIELFPARIRYSSMSLPYHVGNGVFGGGVPFIATLLAGTFTGVPLIGLAYPMSIAAIGVVVSTFGLRHETKNVRIWDEVGGAPLVADRP
jgi:MFS family permease